MPIKQAVADKIHALASVRIHIRRAQSSYILGLYRLKKQKEEKNCGNRNDKTKKKEKTKKILMENKAKS